jgi:hypothetical protein
MAQHTGFEIENHGMLVWHLEVYEHGKYGVCVCVYDTQQRNMWSSFNVNSNRPDQLEQKLTSYSKAPDRKEHLL